MKQTLALMFVGLGLLAMPAGGQNLKLQPDAPDVDYDHEAQFARYKTFAWAPFQQPLAHPANQIRMTQALERELTAKGLKRIDGEGADLLVHFVVKLDEKVKGTPYEGGASWQPSNQRTMVSFDKVKVGTLAVELWEAKTRDIVWSAKVTGVMGPADQIPKRIDDAVKRIIAVYPPAPPTEDTPAR